MSRKPFGRLMIRLMGALLVLVLMGGEVWAQSRWGTVRGMFGERTFGQPISPRPSTFSEAIERGPSGNFLWLNPPGDGYPRSRAAREARQTRAAEWLSPAPQPGGVGREGIPGPMLLETMPQMEPIWSEIPPSEFPESNMPTSVGETGGAEVPGGTGPMAPGQGGAAISQEAAGPLATGAASTTSGIPTGAAGAASSAEGTAGVVPGGAIGGELGGSPAGISPPQATAPPRERSRWWFPPAESGGELPAPTRFLNSTHPGRSRGNGLPSERNSGPWMPEKRGTDLSNWRQLLAEAKTRNMQLAPLLSPDQWQRQLTDRVNQAMEEHRVGQLEVQVVENRVIVRGQVKSEAARSVAANLLLLEPGVWEVDNQLVIAPAAKAER